jgi:CheY-like chemotaxis protein
VTLEPRVKYTYIPYRNQDAIPVFDTDLPDPNYVSLFATNRYAGLDRIGDANDLTLGVTTRTRSPVLPEVPTIDEAGLPGYEDVTWTGLMAPAGTPREVLERLKYVDPDIEVVMMTAFETTDTIRQALRLRACRRQGRRRSNRQPSRYAASSSC